MRRVPMVLAVLALALGAFALPPRLASRTTAASDFVHFESAHVHPACLTPSGDRLLVVNTPDNRLAVFDVTGSAPRRIAEIPVGLEPVSVAARDDSTAWVVNQLSDDVSIVSLGSMHVTNVLRVGDEPSDVVFAGGNAWVSVSQEDAIKVYDAATLAAVGAPVAIAGRMPRALATNAAGTLVYAAVFQAGNRTSVLSAAEVADSLPPANPAPPDSIGNIAPKVGLIIRQQPNGTWLDEGGKTWNAKVKYSLAEVDIAEISAATRAVTRTFGDLGATNFGLAVAADGRLALTSTEARNFVRFEPNVRGHIVDTRVSFVSTAGVPTVRSLDPDTDYGVPTGTQAERDSAIGIPMCVAWSGDGSRAYVTSLASDRLAVVDPAGGADAVLARVPTVAGPSAVVVDEGRGKLYVVGRFRNQLETLSSATLAPLGVTGIGFDPTPDEIVNGRKFFYGGFTSGHGDQACASCHVFGDFDNLAWDLGDPRGGMQPIVLAGQASSAVLDSAAHPMKGPMTTQTLRGLPGTGMLHWRADRASLDSFNGAFVGLMGRTSQLPDSEMAAFDAFTLALVQPPNPNEALDRTAPFGPPGQPSPAIGRNIFVTTRLHDDVKTCDFCHAVTGFRPGTNGQLVPKAALFAAQDMKIPQLRSLYRKVGFDDRPGAVSKVGFGYTHDGSTATLFDFLHFKGFNFGIGADADAKRRDVEAFLLCFDTGMTPAVGRQLTFRGANDNDPALVAQLDTMKTQAVLDYCDLIAKGRLAGEARGWFYQGGDLWKPDRKNEAAVNSAALRALGASGGEITVTGVPKGSGLRMGIDRDRDGWLDADEHDAGSDDGDPASTPLTANPRLAEFSFGQTAPNPFRDAVEVRFSLGAAGRVSFAVYDLFGREVRQVARDVRLGAGPQTLRWDGRDRDGRAAPSGVYFVKIATERATWTRGVVRIR